jgi:Plasmid recombination enzyme
MSGAAFLRIKKLKGGGIITVAARHNRRVIQAEIGASGSIDPTRSVLNETLAGPSTAADVGQLAKDLMTMAGVTKLRKDAVMALEIVFSLPPGHAIDDRAYFIECSTWAGVYFGGVGNILSVDVHRDEAQHHCHVLMLPLIGGRMDGGRLVGNKQKLIEMQKQFHLDVAARYGLSKAPAKLSGASKQAAATAVLTKMRETGDKAMQSAAWATIRAVIETDPGPFLVALGVEQQAPQKKLRTMAQIFTSKGKGKAKEAMSIDFAPPGIGRSLCSVDFTPKAPPPPPATAPPATPAPRPAPTLPSPPLIDPDGVIEAETRVYDLDLDPALFDSTTGEYFQRPPAPARQRKQAADAWVKVALKSRSTHRDKSGFRH